jgi:hypothetical protein
MIDCPIAQAIFSGLAEHQLGPLPMQKFNILKRIVREI